MKKRADTFLCFRETKIASWVEVGAEIFAVRLGLVFMVRSGSPA